MANERQQGCQFVTLSPRKIQKLRYQLFQKEGIRDEAKKRRISSKSMKRTVRLPGDLSHHLTARLGPILTLRS